MNYSVICNTGPLIALAVIDRIDILRHLFEVVAVPDEAAVIGLARDLNTNLILVDERKARKIARVVYGLQVIGSARVLVEAKKRGFIDNVGSALQAMRDGGYWIGDSIVDAALKQAGEV